MKHSFLILLISSALYPSYAQLSIEECYEKAKTNYPLIKQHGLIEKSKDYNLANASKGNLPKVNFSGKATYQSEVTKIPMDLPGVKELDKDQYSLTLDVNQNIWDGGIIKAQKENIKTQAEVDKRSIEVDLYTIRSRVNQIFFGILLHNEMLKQNTIYQEELQRNYNQISAYKQGGIANQSDLDAIEVEQVKAAQDYSKLIHNKKAYLEMLSILIGEKLNENTELIKPDANQLYTLEIQRPELSLFDAQYENLDIKEKEIKAGLMPKLNAFVTGGYGKPGLNMLNHDFSAYYIGGVSLSWSLENFYTKKNNLDNIEINKSMIEAQEETFLFNTSLDVSQYENEILKIREILKSDENIIRLRESIKRSSEVKVANGISSVLDLMKEVNAEQMARQDKIVHEIELIQAIYNLKYITNN